MSSRGVISRMPSGIIAYILAHLATLDDLGAAIRSHRIFLETFNDTPHSVARAIVERQIPDDAAPFVIALAESRQIRHGGSLSKGHDLLLRLGEALADPSQTTRSLLRLHPTGLTLSDLAYCSRNYAAAELLAQSLALDIKPSLAERLRVGRLANRKHLTSAEKTRLVRAFLRFQLLCNVFCSVSSEDGSVPVPVEDGDVSVEETRQIFFSLLPPWINEHLMCVYTWLLQWKLWQAFDELVWHDVEWGHRGVGLDQDMEGNPTIQWWLSSGLEFLSEVTRPRSTVSRDRLLKSKEYQVRDPAQYPSRQFNPDARHPRRNLVLPIGLESTDMRLQEWSWDQLRQLTTLPPAACERVQDADPDGQSCDLWCANNASRSVFGYVILARRFIRNSDDLNLWVCGYNLWDWKFSMNGASPILHFALKDACHDLRTRPPLSRRYEGLRGPEELTKSQRQRADIFAEGGRGWWPIDDDSDFGDIEGLSEDALDRLSDKWNEEAEA